MVWKLTAIYTVFVSVDLNCGPCTDTCTLRASFWTARFPGIQISALVLFVCVAETLTEFWHVKWPVLGPQTSCTFSQEQNFCFPCKEQEICMCFRDWEETPGSTVVLHFLSYPAGSLGLLYKCWFAMLLWRKPIPRLLLLWHQAADSLTQT